MDSDGNFTDRRLSAATWEGDLCPCGKIFRAVGAAQEFDAVSPHSTRNCAFITGAGRFRQLT